MFTDILKTLRATPALTPAQARQVAQQYATYFRDVCNLDLSNLACTSVSGWRRPEDDDVASLHARAGELANTLASHAPITLATTKEALRRLQARLGDENIDDLIRHTYASADFREGMDAFLQKRAPKWSGR